jgi:tetratricopeptide (TPR) repeat protein
MPRKWEHIEPVVNEALAEAGKSPGLEFPELIAIHHGLVVAKIALSQYVDAERIARKCVAMNLKLYGPEHPETGWGYYHLGRALSARNKFTEAIQVQKQALTLMRKAFPPEHRNIAVVLKSLLATLDAADKSRALAELFPRVDELGELESLLRQVLTTAKPSKMEYDDPVQQAVEGLARFSGFYLHLGQELAAAGKAGEADEARRKPSLLLESLQTQFAGNPELLASYYSSGTMALIKAGQPQQAKEFGRKLLGQTTSKTAGFCNNVAWFLATAEDPAHRDSALAVELAKRAVELEPKSGQYQVTLGIAGYRAGDWKQAISDLEKSASLYQGRNSFQLFFLAMAHWQLGHKEEARKCHDQAVVWMAKNLPQDEHLGRFRAEAEKLLSEKDPK